MGLHICEMKKMKFKKKCGNPIRGKILVPSVTILPNSPSFLTPVRVNLIIREVPFVVDIFHIAWESLDVMPAEVIGKYFEINGINKPRTESYTEYCVLEARRLDILLKKTVSARSPDYLG